MKELDPLLHSQLRLAIMSLLLSVEEADFVWLKGSPRKGARLWMNMSKY